MLKMEDEDECAKQWVLTCFVGSVTVGIRDDIINLRRYKLVISEFLFKT